MANPLSSAASTLFDGQAGAPGRARGYLYRTPPRLQVRPATTPTTVYYLAPHGRTASGGVRVIYRHVELLNEMGIPAAVLHKVSGFRAGWFESSARVVSPRTIQLEDNDILVVPEFYGPGLRWLPPNVRLLIFNQGGYHTFDALDRDSTGPGAPYAGLDQLIGVVTVSEDSRALLQHAFPQLPIALCRVVVDGSLFHPGAEPARRQIAYTTTRREEEREQLLHILRARGVDWELAPIAGLTETAVAEVLRRSALFLSFSDRDGFGLPPAEAMACGSYVVGYPGGGGTEFFDPAYSHPVNSLLEFAQAVEDATTRPLEDLAESGRRASGAILTRYSTEGLLADLDELYAPLVTA